ncbi:glycosyltransferase family 39 protein [Sulfurimonas sp. MAG313]|nr:glycosyltransferase family 39 protein [Sulfurimonas sp. MAG313]MDF1879760.1 glycosyltransferase family 39 protein [Sulfurimonas sp. MAG313]
MRNREKLVLLVYTLFNIIANQFLKLYSDEAYYWIWSKKLDFSYFDHPPMVAYFIKLTTLFSDEALFLRLPAALLVSATAYILYLLAKKIFDEQSAVYTFYVFISSIFILAGSTIIAPDTPMMFFWALVLYSAYCYIEEDSKAHAILLGVSGGALLLSKYPGVLVLFTTLVYILMYKKELFKDKFLYIAMGLVLLVFAPVLYWNYIHDFISFTFQLEHGISKEKVFLADEFFNFIGAQLVLFHPFYLIPLFFFILRDKKRFEKKKVYLLLPFLFVIVFFSYNAAFKEANAQWAAGAYLSAAILFGHYIHHYKVYKLLIAGLVFSSVVFILIKTPLGPNYVNPVTNLMSRLGKIDNFSQEINSLNLNLDKYDYIIIDDYHGSEIPYFFKKYKNVIVLANARFSNYNIWRYDENNVSLMSPLTKIPKLGKCLYIGRNFFALAELEKLFGNKNQIAHFQKHVSKWDLHYYFVEYTN